MRIGIAHHLGWAVVVTASTDHDVVDRRRIELIDQRLPAAPIHHEGGTHEMHRSGPALDDVALAALAADVRAADRGWDVHRYDHRTVEADAARLLGSRADLILRGPRAAFGPPWNKDHRAALAATIVAGVA